MADNALHRHARAVVAGCGLFIIGSAQADTLSLAFIEGESTQSHATSEEHGNAWLFNRGGTCFALTPAHVLKDTEHNREYRYARVLIVRPGRTAIEAQADRCAVLKDQDLAIVKVTGVGSIAECGQPWIGQANIDSLLGVNNDMSLSVAGEWGQYQNIPMILRAGGAQNPDTFAIEAKSTSLKLTGGMSGGLVYVGNSLVGMLLSVPTDASRASREGSMVLRIDRISTMLTRYFDSAASVADVDAPSCEAVSHDGRGPPSTGRTLNGPGETELRGLPNRADESCGALVTGWNVPATRADSRPENLLGRGGGSAMWRATATDGEARVDLRLCGTPTSTVSKVIVDTSGCEGSDDVNASVEALVRSDPQAAYSSLGYGKLSQLGRLEISTGSPMLARELRLRFLTSGKGNLCAGALQVN